MLAEYKRRTRIRDSKLQVEFTVGIKCKLSIVTLIPRSQEDKVLFAQGKLNVVHLSFDNT